MTEGRPATSAPAHTNGARSTLTTASTSAYGGSSTGRIAMRYSRFQVRRRALPIPNPEYADDVEVTVTSYVRWPESIRTLVPPPAAARYMPDRHRLTSRELDLDLTGEPLGARAGTRPSARVHGRSVPIPRNFARRASERVRVLRTVACVVSGLGVGRRTRCGRAGERDEVARDIDELSGLIASVHV